MIVSLFAKSPWVRSLSVCFIAMLALVGSNVLAMEYNALVGSSLRYTNNIGLTRQNDDDLISVINAELVGNHLGRYTRVDLNMLASELNYAENSVPDQTRIHGVGFVEFFTASQALTWFIRDLEQNFVIDPILADLPENRVQRRVVSTGPKVQIDLNLKNKLELAATETQTFTDQDNSNDARRRSIQINLARQNAETLRAELELNHNEFEFDRATDYLEDIYLFSLVKDMGNHRLTWSIGESNIRRKNRDDFKSPIYEAIWRITHSKLMATLNVRRLVTNGVIGNTDLIVTDPEFENTDSNINDGSLQKNRVLGLSVQAPLLSDETIGRFRVFRTDEQIEGQDAVNVTTGGDISITKVLSINSQGSVFGSMRAFERGEAAAAGRTDATENQLVGLSYQKRPSNKVTLGMIMDYGTRELMFDNSERTETYRGTSVTFSINYRLR